MLIAITVDPERAEEIKKALEIFDYSVSLEMDSEEFHTVMVNFEEARDLTVAQAVRAVLAFAIEVG